MKKILTRCIAGFIMLSAIVLWQACDKKEDLGPSVENTISSYYPNSGNAGTLVTIEGKGFSSAIGDYQASIGQTPAEVISATTDAIVIRIPEGGATGAIELRYQDKVLKVGAYTYQDLSITRVFPENGPAGSQVRIGGTGFGSTENPAEVYINAKKALVVSVTDTLIVAEIPEAAGTGAVKVMVAGKESTGQNFIYQAISSIKPLTGGAGTKVTISGEGFEMLKANNVVEFNGKLAVVLEATEAQLIVQAPAEVATGPLDVKINNQKTSGPVFTVVDKPVVSVVTPLSGPKGAQMTITGSLFSKLADENQVYINNVLVPVESSTETQLKLTIPGGTGSGIVKVVVNDQITNGPQFKDQNLGILAMSPDNGLAGTTVTITGTGFSTNAAENKVYFNGVQAPVKTATETTLELDAPVGLSTGRVRVVVGSAEAESPQAFRRAGVITLAGGQNSNTFGLYMAGIAVNNNGDVYVTDRSNKVVKKISANGSVSILQANGADILFETPYGIVIDKQNNIYVSDISRNHIRKITPSGQNTILVSGFSPGLMAIDDAGNLYVNVNTIFGGMNKVNSAGGYSRISGPSWPTAQPFVDANGTLYYVDSGSSSNNAVSRIPSTGGNELYWVGNSDAGYTEGVGSAVRFNGITGGVAPYGAGTLIAGDRNNYAIRQIDVASRTASTLVKFAGPGFADGSFAEARVGTMDAMAVDKDGNIYILDAQNKAVRKVFLK